MRRRLALTTAAIAVLIVVAFLVPLALLVRSLAEDRALSAADRSAATLAPVLTAVSDRDSIRQVVLANQAADVGDVSVFLADDTVLGEPAIIDDDVALARDGHPSRRAPMEALPYSCPCSDRTARPMWCACS